MYSNYKNSFYRIALSLSLLLVISCTNNNQKASTGTVSDIIGQTVTKIYNEGRVDDFAECTQEEVLQEFNEEDKKVLATRYWVFNINQEATVYVCRDTAQEEVPFWLPERGFERTDLKIKNRFDTYEVWKKTFPAGEVQLGIPGFDRHRAIYFTAVKATQSGQPLVVEPIFPKHQIQNKLDVGSSTYFDWEELVITELPDELKGATLLVTNRGRSREAHLIDAFRKTKFPSTDTIDQILLTWTGDSKTSMTLGWRTSTDVKKCSIRYWEANSRDTLQVKVKPEVLEDRMLANDRYTNRFRAYLKELKPGITYQYQLTTTDYTSPIYSFTTDDGGNKFEFGWFGDTHNDPEWGKMLRKVDSAFPKVKFYLQSGDLVNTGLYRNDWDEFIAYSGNVFRRKPLMAVPGNHDAQEGLPPTLFSKYLKYPQNGPREKTPGLTYTFVYGNTQFFMLDCVSSPVEEQADWLEKQLQQSDATFKLAVFHFAPFTPHENYQIIKNAWVPLFEKYGVDLVLNGHFHYYQRTKAYGAELSETGTPTYIMAVGTTAKNEDTESRKNEIICIKDHIFPHFTVSKNRLTMVVYDQNLSVIDRYVIEK